MKEKKLEHLKNLYDNLEKPIDCHINIRFDTRQNKYVVMSFDNTDNKLFESAEDVIYFIVNHMLPYYDNRKSFSGFKN